MHPKIKPRPAGNSGKSAAAKSLRPLLLHDVVQQTASANDASRHSVVPVQPASGTANHSRHHVSRHTQS